jgi:hypothetical protein
MLQALPNNLKGESAMQNLNNQALTYLFVGNAALPKGTAAYEHFKVMDAVLEIEWETGLIVDAGFSLITALAHDFLVRIVKGHCVLTSMHTVKQMIEERYHLASQRAIIQAIEIACQKYQSLRHNGVLPVDSRRSLKREF